MAVKIENCIFPILNRKENAFKFIGTGFFISKSYFITAAHVLSESYSDENFILIQNELVSLSDNVLNYEYLKDEKQIAPDLRDLLIVRLENYLQEYLSFAEVSLRRDLHLFSSGFHESEENIGESLSLDANMQPDASRLIFDRKEHSIIFADKAMVQSYNQYLADIEPKFTNCFTCINSIPSGMSGSPLLDINNDCYGLALMSVNDRNMSIFLNKEYIISRIKIFLR